MKKVISFILVLLLLLSITACGDGNNSSTTKDTVRLAVDAVFYDLNPQTGIVGFVNQKVMDQVYEPMVRIDDKGNVVPLLAEKWEVADDCASVVFHLRKGVKFHNGEEMKASDVVFTFEKAKEAAALDYYVSNIASVNATGDYDVTITLKDPSYSFITKVAEVAIINEKYYNEVAGDMSQQGCGTGPYKFESIDFTTEVKLVANNDYWGGKPAIKNVIFQPITDSNTAISAFENNEVDFLLVTSISSYKPLVDSGLYNTSSIATLHTTYVTMNNEVAPFDNKLVRQALTYAADRATMITIAYEGLAEPARMMASENCYGVDFSDATVYDYNLEKAKELLAEAGYPDGINFKEDFGITMDIISGGHYEKYATVFQQCLQQIGCTLELRASESYSSDAVSGNYAIMTQGMTFGFDGSYLEGLYGTSGIGSKNHARYSNPEVDDLFKKADLTTDDSVRKECFKKITEIIVDDCPVIPCYHKEQLYAWAKDLSMVPHVATNHPYFINEWKWE